jgi:hypothetical protein
MQRPRVPKNEGLERSKSSQSLTPPQNHPEHIARRVAPCALLATAWAMVFFRIHDTWIANPVYAYGWSVPWLALYLARERWLDRPTAGATPGPGLVWAVALLLLGAYLPIRIIQEANPDWVKINWALVGVAAGFSVLAAWAQGGLRQAVHFLFPVLFCFTALPWPVWLEEELVQGLMRGNASVCAEVLTFAGLPALAQGNLIQVANTLLNVEEACSGIQSLQTAFMMALFLGEFHRVTLARRAGLLATALSLAVVGNLGRTLILAFGARTGAAERWHDPVGQLAMVLTLTGVWFAARWIRGQTPTDTATTPAPGPASTTLSPVLAGLAVVSLLGTEAATELWYRRHEVTVEPARPWTVTWPTGERSFREVTLHARARALLRFDSGSSAAWTDADGHQWNGYFLSWEPGRVSKYLAMSHYPSVCLPATGLNLVAETAPWEWRHDQLRLPFAGYRFTDAGRAVHVFHCIAEDRPRPDDAGFTYHQVTTEERLASVRRGERNLGQRVLGLAVHGCASPQEARRLVEQTLGSLVKPPRKP